MNFTEPTIVDKGSKSYVSFYLEGKRQRLYSGKSLGISLYPNKAKNEYERLHKLESLRLETLKQLASGTFGNEINKEENNNDSIRDLLTVTLSSKIAGVYSTKYKNDLIIIHKEFIEFLTTEELNNKLSYLTATKVNMFLKQFNSSGTYYMKKRSDLRILLNAMCKMVGRPLFMNDTITIKRDEKKHAIYEEKMLGDVLMFLKEHNYKTYICALMTYSTWLRPHVEIRNLKVSYFEDDFRYITLPGKTVKNKRNRTVYVPDFLREELKGLDIPNNPNANIFTGTEEPLNPWYFTTSFNRLKSDMLTKGIIGKNHTLYSFRHTAALNLYNKTKDITNVMNAMDHSSIIVTQRYLRTIGKVDLEKIAANAPTAPNFLTKRK